MNIEMAIDTLWVLLAAMLVFFMNLGFAAVEAGFARSKNTVNILSKNFTVFAVSNGKPQHELYAEVFYLSY
jgi:ammonium transporter, Amt family